MSNERTLANALNCRGTYQRSSYTADAIPLSFVPPKALLGKGQELWHLAAITRVACQNEMPTCNPGAGNRFLC